MELGKSVLIKLVPHKLIFCPKKKKKKKSGLFFNLNDCFNTDPCRNNLAEFKFYDRYGDE